MPTQPRLAQDQRGAIVVVAIVMGAVLTGAGFHLLEIQRAIAYRERAQTLADAIVGEGAYWHAQGMNLLAFINICMAIVLSAFVAVRAAELVAVTAGIVLTFLPFVGSGAALTAARIAERMYNVERRITRPIMRALNFGTDAERAVSAAFPYIALAASAAKDPPHGVAFGPALFPTAPDRLLRRDIGVGGDAQITTFPARMGGRLGADGGRIVSRLQRRFPRATGASLNLVGSLPVEEEDYYQLCSRASRNLGRFPFIDQIPFAEEALGWLGGNLPGLMCQPLSEARNLVERQIESQAREGAENRCTQEESEWRDAQLQQREEERNARSRCQRFVDGCRERWQRWRGTYEAPPDPTWSRQRRADCRRDRRRQLEEDGRRDAERIERSEQGSTDTIKTAKLWNLIVPAQDAGGSLSPHNPFLHVWSQRIAPEMDLSARWRPLLRMPQRGAGVPGVPLPSVDSFEMNASSAKALFYHQCAEPEAPACMDNSMWRMRWRYRFGVDRDASEELINALGDSVRGYLGHLEGQLLSAGLGRLLQGIGRSNRVENWQRDRGNPAARVDVHSIWLRRLLGAGLTARSGRIHCAFWCSPLTNQIPSHVTDKLYFR